MFAMFSAFTVLHMAPTHWSIISITTTSRQRLHSTMLTVITSAWSSIQSTHESFHGSTMTRQPASHPASSETIHPCTLSTSIRTSATVRHSDSALFSDSLHYTIIHSITHPTESTSKALCQSVSDSVNSGRSTPARAGGY